MAVRAYERAQSAHERLDRQSTWMAQVDDRMNTFAEKLSQLAADISSLKAKVAFGAAIGSLVGAAVAVLLANIISH